MTAVSIPLNAQAPQVWPPYLSRGRRRFPRAWQPWTEEEETLLKELHGKMLSLNNISKILGRGLNGIRLRLQRLNLLSPAKDAWQALEYLKPNFSPLPKICQFSAETPHANYVKWLTQTAQSWGVEKDNLHLAVKSLRQTHWLVLALHYGWTDQPQYELEDIAQLLGRSISAIRQICSEAEEILRIGLEYYTAQQLDLTAASTCG